MSKSNKKYTDRLKDPQRRDKIKDNRHQVKKLLNEGRWEEAEDLEEEFSTEEKD